MTIRLVVNADDLGHSAAIDRGIVRAARDGIVRSTSALAAGPTLDAALVEAQAAGLGIGVHLALSGGLRPAAAPDLVRSLVVPSPTGPRLRRGWPEFVGAWAAGRVDLDEVEAELTAQVEHVVRRVPRVDHLDGHQHLHVLPPIWARVLRVAERFSIRAVRLPLERGATRHPKIAVLALLARRARRTIPANMRHPDSFLGLALAGRLDEPALLGVLDALGPGTHELGCHPGDADEPVPEDPSWRYGWRRELEALTSPRVLARVRARGIELVDYGALA